MRKIQGIDRPSGRLLDCIGTKVRFFFPYQTLFRSFCTFDSCSDIWKHLQVLQRAIVRG
jgi:hypothetical protein